MLESLGEQSVLVIGTGGLGGSALLALAAAGVGRLAFCDSEHVDISDLAGHPLFRQSDLGMGRARAAERRLGELYPELRLEALECRFDEPQAREMVQGSDLVLNGSGDFAAAFLANDLAVATRRPLVHGAVLLHAAQLLTVMPGTTGCLRCLFEEPPPAGSVPTAAQVGVLSPLAGFAGALMAQEALRLLGGERGAYAGRLLVYEAQPARSRLVPVRVRAGCPVCAGIPRSGGFPRNAHGTR
jgi:molybdopterin-synthase adenylyltransferase